jgi:hypothetical protein
MGMLNIHLRSFGRLDNIHQLLTTYLAPTPSTTTTVATTAPMLCFC